MPAIEVILKKPVHALGAESDIVKVKPGYARNYLFPQSIAIPATAASKRQIESLKKIRAEREAQEQGAAEEIASKLSKATVTFQMHTGSAAQKEADEESKAKVFGSVTASEIVTRLAEMGFSIEKKRVILPHPLKELGEHSVVVHLPYNIETKIKIVLAGSEPVDEDASAKGKSKGKAKGKEGRKDNKKSATDEDAPQEAAE